MDRRAYLTTLLVGLSGCGSKQETESDRKSLVVANAEIIGDFDSISVDARFVNMATKQSPGIVRVTLKNQNKNKTITLSGGGYLPFDTASSTDAQYVLSAVDDSRTNLKERARWTGECWKLDGKATSYPVGVSEELDAGEQLQTRYHLFALEECVSGTFEFESALELNGNNEQLALTVRID